MNGFKIFDFLVLFINNIYECDFIKFSELNIKNIKISLKVI